MVTCGIHILLFLQFSNSRFWGWWVRRRYCESNVGPQNPRDRRNANTKQLTKGLWQKAAAGYWRWVLFYSVERHWAIHGAEIHSALLHSALLILELHLPIFIMYINWIYLKVQLLCLPQQFLFLEIFKVH